ncbi:helix-turn-helix domain-containing protein [Kitasatospora sp. NPDC056531]|uniref:helix-turn-helix domain-containing protein n=1 Tax=Kitasatospora sp. NPDC056531 TaxID=3345856 RepID=UPI0036948051
MESHKAPRLVRQPPVGPDRELIPQPEFGGLVKSRRVALGMTQRDLACPGLSMSYISLLESGQRHPTRGAVQALSAQLKVDPEYFLAEIRPEPSTESTDVVRRIVNSLTMAAVGEDRLAEAGLREVLAAPDTPPAVGWQAKWELAQLLHSTAHRDARVELLDLINDPASQDTPLVKALAYVMLAHAEREYGALRQAMQYARSALQEHTAVSSGGAADTLHARALTQLIAALCELGEVEQAQPLAEELAGIVDNVQTPEARAMGQSAIAHALMRGGDHTRGRVHQDLALRELSVEADVRLWGRLRKSAVTVALDTHPEPDVARLSDLLDEATHALTLVGTAADRLEVSTNAAALDLLREHPQEAVRKVSEALERTSDASGWDLGRAHLVLARAHRSLGEADAAAADYRAAADDFERAGAYQRALAVWRESVPQ